MKQRFLRLTLVAIAVVCLKPLQAQPVLSFQQVLTGLSNPVDFADPGDGKVYIVQQGGLIRSWNGSTLATFLNVSSLITNPAGSEQGLLSLAFHPNYLTNRYFFIWYTGTSGLLTLARYQRDASNPDIADPATAQVLFTQAKPGATPFTNHNGAKINFGPDGYLYIGTGDGGSGGDPFNLAQNTGSYLGKMLRIDVNGFATSAPFYAIPPSNPFLTPGDGILDEIYAIGLRNPWRWSFDRATGDMWIADVGQSTMEEVNFLPAGSTAGVNYGWDCYEGNQPYSGSSCTPPGTIVPIFTYGRSSTTGGFSVTGGYVYRGTEYPGLQGYYIMVDYVSGNLWTIRPNGPGSWAVNLQSGLPNNISSFGEAADGTLYVLKRNTGVMFKVVLSSVVPVRLTRFSGEAGNDYNELTWESASESAGMSYGIEHSADGRQFTEIGGRQAIHPSGGRYTYRDIARENEYAYYRLSMKEPDGSKSYSNIISLKQKKAVSILYSNMISGDLVNLSLSGNEQQIRLLDLSGKTVWQQGIAGMRGRTSLQLPKIAPGLYVLSASGRAGSRSWKVLIR